MQNSNKNYRVFAEVNHWWAVGSLRPEFLEKIERTVFPNLLQTIHERQIVLLEGPRRVGKTSLIYQLIHHLLTHHVPAKRLFYLSVDDPLLERATLFEDIISFIEQYLIGKALSETNEPFFLFLDEITKFKDWELYLKRYYDLKYPFKIIASSSSAAFLQKKTRESLVGRVMTLAVTPLTFSEVMRMHVTPPEVVRCYSRLNQIWKESLFSESWAGAYQDLVETEKSLLFHRKEIEARLHAYLLHGGFPEYLQIKDERNRHKYFWENVADRVIFYDLPQLFNVGDRTLLRNLLLNCVENSGRMLNINDLANSYKAPRQTISNYLQYLQASQLTFLLEKYAKTAASRMRAYKKVCVADPGLFVSRQRLSLEKIELQGAWGILAELVVFLHLEHYAETSQVYYHRERDKEVDFVLEPPSPPLPIEVKYRRRTGQKLGAKELPGLADFHKRFQSRRALVISRDLLELRGDTLFVPLHLFVS